MYRLQRSADFAKGIHETVFEGQPLQTFPDAILHQADGTAAGVELCHSDLGEKAINHEQLIEQGPQVIEASHREAPHSKVDHCPAA